MSQKQIKAVVTGEKGEIIGEATVNANIPDTLQDYTTALGGDVVTNLLKQKYVINLQAYMRGLVRKGKKQDEIQTAVNSWKPGLVKEKRPATEKAFDLFEGMSPEQQAEFLKKLKARAAAGK